jgi:hypothetical protein
MKASVPEFKAMPIGSLVTRRWREVDSNFPFRALNEHRTAPDRSSALSL